MSIEAQWGEPCQRCQLEDAERQLERLKNEFSRINVQDSALMEQVRGYANAEHGLVVDMDDGTGRTGLYIETGFLRNLLNEVQELRARVENCTCNAEELRQVREERDALLVSRDQLEKEILRLREHTKRYSTDELLRDVTPDAIQELHADTAWFQTGGPVGREML